MSASKDEAERLLNELTEGIRSLREREREAGAGEKGAKPAPYDAPEPHAPLAARDSEPAKAKGNANANANADAVPMSPERDSVNAKWDVSTALVEPPQGKLGRALSFLRAPLQKLVRFALGPVVERQVAMNSAQVQFDNDVVRYLDERVDRLSRHYDEVLGLHGKRMEEIDERHLILQQELIRHVHDLVERIEFVFESAEQNHLYLEGMLREAKEDLSRLLERLQKLSPRE